MSFAGATLWSWSWVAVQGLEGFESRLISFANIIEFNMYESAIKSSNLMVAILMVVPNKWQHAWQKMIKELSTAQAEDQKSVLFLSFISQLAY